jgi:hypothetical protein
LTGKVEPFLRTAERLVERGKIEREDRVRAQRLAIAGLVKELDHAKVRLKELERQEVVTLKPPIEQLEEMAGEGMNFTIDNDVLMMEVRGMTFVVTPDDVERWGVPRGTRWTEAQRWERAGVYECPPWVAYVPTNNLDKMRIFGLTADGKRTVHKHPHAANGRDSGLPCWGDPETRTDIRRAMQAGDWKGVVRVLMSFMGSVNFEHGYSPPWDWAKKVGELKGGPTKAVVGVKVVKPPKVRVVRPPADEVAEVMEEEEEEEEEEEYHDYEPEEPF